MGFLFYGTSRQPIHMHDTLLAHFKLVMINKLRTHQSFVLNWKDDDPHAGRHSVWISPSAEYHFHFTDPDRPDIDQDLLARLQNQANSARGVDLLDEATLNPNPSWNDPATLLDTEPR